MKKAKIKCYQEMITELEKCCILHIVNWQKGIKQYVTPLIQYSERFWAISNQVEQKTLRLKLLTLIPLVLNSIVGKKQNFYTWSWLNTMN